MDINSIIKQITKDESTSSEKVRKEIQKAIDIAWNSGNEQERENQKKLFPNGKPGSEKAFP